MEYMKYKIEKLIGETEEFIKDNNCSDEWTDEYKYFLQHKNRYRYCSLLLSNLKPGKLLDIGCHFLHFGMIANKMNFTVTGVDIPTFINSKCLEYRAHTHNITLFEIDFNKSTNLLYNDNSFDYVVLFETLEHLRINPFNLIKEINRILRKNGCLLLSVPNYFTFYKLFNTLRGKGHPPSVKQLITHPDYAIHWKEFTIKELVELLYISNFKIISINFITYNKMNLKIKKNSKAIYHYAIICLNELFDNMIPSMKENIIITAKK